MKDENDRLDNTIKIVADILEKNKDNPKVKDAYEQVKALKEKRNIR